MWNFFRRRHDKLCLGVGIAVIAALLLCRDVWNVTIGKLWFVLAVALVLLFLDAAHTRLLVFFLFPLYSGLPGNYITLLLLLKLIILGIRKRERYHFSAVTAACGVIFALFVVAQNLMYGDLTAYHFALCAEIVLLFLFCMGEGRPSLRASANLYAVAVILAGVCSLFVYARIYSFSEIFSGFIRFGDDYGAGGMKMSLDPNFLGFFCLSAMAAHMELLRRERGRAWETALSVLFLPTLGLLGLIGLSRSFILCLAGLIFLELAACVRKPRRFFVALFCLVLLLGGGLLIAQALMPSLIRTLISRFSSADVWSGNGRIELIVEWWQRFTSSPRTVLLGTGLFHTNVHMTVLQYLFGLGVFGGTAAMIFYIGCAKCAGLRLTVHGKIPTVAVFVLSCALPAACSLSALFPMVLAACFSAWGDVTAAEKRPRMDELPMKNRFLRGMGRALYLVAGRLPPSYSKVPLGQRRFRALCARLIITSCGERVNVEKDAHFASDIVVGHDSAIGIRADIGEKTVIGNYVMMGPDCLILTKNHRFDRTDIPMCKQGDALTEPVIVGDDVWIGARVIILPGTIIGHGAVIGAGSVVSGNIPPMAVAAGNPARVLRMRDASENEERL